MKTESLSSFSGFPQMKQKSISGHSFITAVSHPERAGRQAGWSYCQEQHGWVWGGVKSALQWDYNVRMNRIGFQTSDSNTHVRLPSTSGYTAEITCPCSVYICVSAHIYSSELLVGPVQLEKMGHHVNIFTPWGPLNVSSRFIEIAFSSAVVVHLNMFYEVHSTRICYNIHAPQLFMSAAFTIHRFYWNSAIILKHCLCFTIKINICLCLSTSAIVAFSFSNDFNYQEKFPEGSGNITSKAVK